MMDASLTGHRDRPVIIGIVGDSGTGKSTFAQGLAEVLGRERAVVICMDDYHKYSRRARAGMDITPHDPACNYIDILEQHVALLREGQPILKPIYNHNGGVLEPPEYVRPARFIILEGLLGYSTPKLLEMYDVKFYMEPQEQLRLRWKFQRDTTYGGYTVDQVMASLAALDRDSRLYVHPQRVFADMIVNFYPPDEDAEETGARLNVRHILKPTLPYLDLAPVLEKGAGAFDLELARDVDGRPVDALHILGAVDDGRAAELQEFLWGLMPHRPSHRPRLGAFRDARNQTRHSQPLALSQLLVTHYLLNAALAPHAS